MKNRKVKPLKIIGTFYIEFVYYRSLLIKALEIIPEEKIRIKYSQILFDRLMLLCFIQTKSLLDGNNNYLFQKFEETINNNKNYYSDFLKPLFFRGLSEQGFYVEWLGKLPFLNGDLFQEHEVEKRYPDLNIENDIFSQILIFLNSYNWHANEGSTLEEERRITPEILGHIFEKTINALSDSGIGQKEKGAYYTPEIITTFISESAIFYYLLGKINSKFGLKLRSFIDVLSLNEKPSPKEVYLFLLEKILPKMSIIDNACGSGAFILAVLNVLSPVYEKIFYPLLDCPLLQQVVSDYLKFRRKDSSWMMWHFDSFDNFHSNSRWRYFIKRYIIINNLYGVDIEEGAIEIAKIRLWLALFSDIENKIEDIEPLPNIEYNLRCGNSLIGLAELKSFSGLDNFLTIADLSNCIKNLKDFYPKESNEIESLSKTSQLKNIIKIKQILMDLYKRESNENNLQVLKKILDELSSFLTNKLNENYLAIINNRIKKPKYLTLDQLIKLRPFHWIMEFPQLFCTSETSDQNGFNIAIGNPPYGNLLSDAEKMVLKAFNIATKEIAGSFIYKSFEILQKSGIIAVIMTYAITFQKELSALRNQLKNKFETCNISTFDRDKCRFFEGMSQSVSITFCFNRRSRVESPFLKPKTLKKGDCEFFTTQMFRSMPNLSTLQYQRANEFLLGSRVGVKFSENHRLPKLGESKTLEILTKLIKIVDEKNPFSVGDLLGRLKVVKSQLDYDKLQIEKNSVLWLRTSGNYWYNAWSDPPYFGSDIAYSPIKINDPNVRSFLLLLINSSLLYLWFRIYSDGRHMNVDVLNAFPLPKSFQNKLVKYRQLIKSTSNLLISIMMENFDKDHERFLSSIFKPVLDFCDLVLGTLYDLDKEEIRFIQNFESEVRSGNLIPAELYQKVSTFIENYSESEFKQISEELKTIINERKKKEPIEK